jgi:hypothetical protein
MSREWVAQIIVGALLSLVVSLVGCAGNYKEPVPDQPHMPLTASWSESDSGQTP